MGNTRSEFCKDLQCLKSYAVQRRRFVARLYIIQICIIQPIYDLEVTMVGYVVDGCKVTYLEWMSCKLCNNFSFDSRVLRVGQ